LRRLGAPGACKMLLACSKRYLNLSNLALIITPYAIFLATSPCKHRSMRSSSCAFSPFVGALALNSLLRVAHVLKVMQRVTWQV
jgi:hypothetical protein